MDKLSEIKAVEAIWSTLDDSSIIRDVLFKGKLIQNAIRFISDRNGITISESKDIFVNVCDTIVLLLIQNKQAFRASHVLKNAQINDIHYFYNFHLETKDPEIKSTLYEFLCRNANFKEDEIILKAYHTCFKLLEGNIEKHCKYLDNLNRIYSNSNVTVYNIQNIKFPKFMNQPVQWRSDISIDVFFKSKKDPRIIDLLPILDKNSFFTYIIQNELNTLLRKWLNEQYLCRAGKSIDSELSEPYSFEKLLGFLFKKWNFEDTMMTQMTRRQRDVVKNEFAKLGFFEPVEDKQVCRKLNRFFTTHSFVENVSLLKPHEITKFILENKLLNLLPQKFINHDYIQSIITESNEDSSLCDVLVLLESLKNLLTKETSLENFVDIMNTASAYIQKYDASFNCDQKELHFMNEIMTNDLAKFHKIANINSFTRNLFIKLNAQQVELPSIEELVLDNFSLNLEHIRDEFQNSDNNYIPNFDDPELSTIYGEKVNLTFLDYIERYQGVYATYVFILDAVRNSMTVSRQMILSACEEVLILLLQSPQNELLVTHCLAFMETLYVDTKNIRCYLQLLKLKPEGSNFEKSLDKMLGISSKSEDIKNLESLEVFWKFSKFDNPKRTYLNPFIQNNDWFKLILMGQYFDYSLSAFISICQNRIKNRTLCDNLIRAIRYEASSEHHNSLSYRNIKINSSSSQEDLLDRAQFLDSKHDLFAILLKSNESVSRVDASFDEFQNFFTNKSIESDDLLFQSVKYDWPLLAVLAATSKLYRIKYCWLTWTILSSNFTLNNGKLYKDTEQLATELFEHCIRIGFIRTLEESVTIFYPETPMKIFTEFLKDTREVKFNESMLKYFIVQLYENDFKMKILKGKHRLIPFIIKCLIIHLQYNIKLSNEQQEFLACINRSEIAKFDGRIDFELLKNLCVILEHTDIEVNYEEFYECENKTAKEIDRICDELINNNHFETAIEIANLMNKSKTNFVFKFWLHMRKTDDQKQILFDVSRYMKYVNIYGIKMDVFIKFLKLVIDELEECSERYNIMIFILRNMGKSEPKDLDELEYEIICLYVRLKSAGVIDIKPLTSLYFENVIKTERSLIHNSLYELKSIAMIDDIKVSQCLTNESEIKQLDELIFELLDINDIVQVLRIQAMFSYAPEDLKILVYLISVAEGITSIYDITKQERQTIRTYGKMSNRFNRFTLRALRTNSSISMDSSGISTDMNESSILEEPMRYQENKETLQALQGLLYKMKHGTKYGQRVILIYRISLFLHDQSFNDLFRVKNSFDFLENVALSNCDNKLLAMNDVIDAMEMTREEVSQFISKEITACIIKTRFMQFNKDTESNNSTLNIAASVSSTSTITTLLSGPKQVLDDIWGLSLSRDLHLILELCKGKTTLLGNYLLKFYKVLSQPSADIPIKCDSLPEDLRIICEDLNRSLESKVMSLKKQNIIRVELLITAHDCFCHECSTEGIGDILYSSKIFIKELAEKRNFNMIVKLMCGIGRYREMFYCFDILVKNEAFENLLGQFNDKQSNGLKNALLLYLNEHHPKNIEYFKMCASHFMMYTELAKIWRSSAMDKIKRLQTEHQAKFVKSGRVFTNQILQNEIPYIKCTKNSLSLLNEAITDMIHATEMMTADKKIESSLKFTHFCELIAMQIHLVKVSIETNIKICPFVLHQEQNAEKFQIIAQYFANYELSVPQALILNKNVVIPIDFAKVLFCRVLMNGDEPYLADFIKRVELNDLMIEKIIKLTQLEAISKKQEKILQELCLMIRDVGLKFRLASLLGLKGILQQLLNDEQSYHYLLDSKYGNNEIY